MDYATVVRRQHISASVFIAIDPIDIETPEGSLIQNLTIEDRANASGWGISSIKLDGKIFGDRDFTFTEVPDSVKGAEQIVTACNSKNSIKDVASFIVAKAKRKFRYLLLLPRFLQI